MTSGDRGQGQGQGQRDDGADVLGLLNAIRKASREDEDETASLAADSSFSLSDETRERIVGSILRAQAQANERLADPRSVANLAASGDDALTLRWRFGAPTRRSLGFAASGLAVALAAAAAFSVWMRPANQAAMLPAYFVSASGGVSELRAGKPDPGTEDGTTVAPPERLRSESELRVVCRPDTAITGPLAVRAFFVQGYVVDEVIPVIQLAASGAVELRLHGHDLLARHRGQGRLRVVVGRPRAIRAVAPPMAASESDERYGSASVRSDRRWLTVPLDLLESR